MLLSINSRIIDKPANLAGLSLGKGWESVDYSINQLESSVKKGFAFSAQFVDGHRSRNKFKEAGFLAIDIDEGMSLDDALENDYIKSNASLIYTTPNHTADNNRFRIVFELVSPITASSDYEAAQRSLIQLFNSDPSCKDAARLYFGSSKAFTKVLNKKLSAEELRVLIETGQVQSGKNPKDDQDEHNENGTPYRSGSAQRVSYHFGDDFQVQKADGSWVLLKGTQHNTTILCPFHNDKNPSAFTFISKKTTVGIYCHTCEKSFFPANRGFIADFYWYKKYQNKALEYYGLNDDSEAPFNRDSPLIFDYSPLESVQVLDCKFLPNIPAREGITFIRSPKGSGKTKQLEALVANLKEEGKSILLIGHRRLLVKSLAQRLGLPCYIDKSKFKKEYEKTGNAAMSLDSLMAIPGLYLKKFDAVIVDESEQVIAHLLGETLDSKRDIVFKAFLFYLKNAKHVICLDADLGLVTNGVFKICLDDKRHIHYVLNSFRLPVSKSMADSHATHRLVNSLRLSSSENDNSEILDNSGHVLNLYQSRSALLKELLLDLENGKRCFVASNSKKIARAIHDLINESLSTRKCLLITAETTKSKAVTSFIKAPAQESLKYDVVTYSPALSTGIDITFKNDAQEEVQEVDSVYGFFEAGITTHFEVDQQLSRVRSPKAIKLHINERKLHLETNPEAIKAEMIARKWVAESNVTFNDDGLPVLTDDTLLDLAAWILAVQRASINNLRDNFIELREQAGWCVNYIEQAKPGINASLKFRQSKGVIDLHEALKLSEPEYRNLIKIGDAIGFEPAEQASINRYELERFYGADATEELLRLDANGTFRPKIELMALFVTDESKLSSEDQSEIRFLNSMDWKHRLPKKRLLSELLDASGIYSEEKGFDASVDIEMGSLLEFQKKVFSKHVELKNFLGISVRKDLVDKPMLQLKAILSLLGLDLLNVQTKQGKGKPKVYTYRLDSARLATVMQLTQTHLKSIEDNEYREY